MSIAEAVLYVLYFEFGAIAGAFFAWAVYPLIKREIDKMDGDYV